jgi:type II secretion system protein N
VKQRLIRIAKFLAYPAFYAFCLFLFGYLTFPWNRLRDRVIAEFQAAQKGKNAGQRLEIDELDSYWFTGVELKGVRLYLPPSEESGTPANPFGGGSSGDKPAPKESVIEIDEAQARLQVLPLLIGRVRVKFWASAFGGEMQGTIPYGASSGPVELSLKDVDLAKVSVLNDLVGVPMKGVAQGKLELAAADGKFSKASGSLDLTIAGVAVGDGKTKIKGTIALPEAKVGDLVIQAEAKDGILKVGKLEANGSDLELAGDGKVSVREPWNDSSADLYMRFKFTDAYRNKSDITKTLLGAPGSTMPSLLDLADPKIKRAKRADGFYNWHIYGALKRLKFDPAATDGPAGAKGRGKGNDSPFSVGAKKPNPFPLGGPSGKDDEDKPSSPPQDAPPARQPQEAPAAETPPPAPPPPSPDSPPADRGEPVKE